jgi:hypothetical protein
MTIQRRDRTRRLQLEPLEARDVPSVASPHAELLRPTGRAEIRKSAHHHVQPAQVHAPAPVAASSTASAGDGSSSTASAGNGLEPMTGVVSIPLGPPHILGTFHIQVIGPVVGTLVPIKSRSSR